MKNEIQECVYYYDNVARIYELIYKRNDMEI